MVSLRHPVVIAFALLSATAGLVWWRPAPAAGARPGLVATPAPERVGGWQGKVLGVDASAVAILETEDVALREYTRGAEPPVWLAQVGGFGNRAAFHPPELCYVGSHYEVEAREPRAVGPGRRVMRLRIRQGADRFEAWYWFTAGGRMTSNYYQQQWWLMTDALRGEPMSGTLVRISTTLDEPVTAHRRLLDFVTSWEQAASDGGST